MFSFLNNFVMEQNHILAKKSQGSYFGVIYSLLVKQVNNKVTNFSGNTHLHSRPVLHSTDEFIYALLIYKSFSFSSFLPLLPSD